MEEVPLGMIREIKGGKTFYLFANILDITTAGGRRLKIVVEGRDGWLAAIEAERKRQSVEA